MNTNIKKNEPKILILGLDSSGKTTILMKLKDFKNQEICEIYPTPFLKTEKIYFDNKQINLIEISGQIKFRKHWEMFYQDVSGIFFIIDGTDEKRMPIVRDLIFEMNKQIQNKMPIQFLVNKFDVEGVLEIKTLREYLELDKLNSNLIWECVSFTGLNLREAINHILNNAGNK